MRKLLFILLMFLPTYSCFANDTAFGGEGSTPMPIKQENVTMVDENIVITGHEINRSDMKGNWEYNCDYTFKNETDNALSFTMGFPFPVNDELSEVAIPSNFVSKKGGALVYNFQVSVDGKTVPAMKSKITPVPEKGLQYEEAYIWKIAMSPNQIVKIHHHYITGVTINSMGQNYVSFVLKTGALWKDSVIKSSKFKVVPNTATKLCNELDKNAEYLTPKPSGMKIVGEGKDRQYVWELENFHPNDDLELCLITGKNYVRYYIVYPMLQYTGYQGVDVKQLSAKELRILRNTIYAQYGKRFQDADLQAYFDKQWWYEPNPNYSDQALTDEDKKALTIISKQE